MEDQQTYHFRNPRSHSPCCSARSTLIFSSFGPTSDLDKISPKDDCGLSASLVVLPFSPSSATTSSSPSLTAVFLAGVAKGLDTVFAPDDQPPKAEDADTVLLNVFKAFGALEEEATGCAANVDELLTAPKGEAAEEKDPNVACGFFTGAGVERDSELEVADKLLASRTLAEISFDSDEPLVLPDNAEAVGLAEAKGDDAEENEPNVACGFFAGVDGTIGVGAGGGTSSAGLLTSPSTSGSAAASGSS